LLSTRLEHKHAVIENAPLEGALWIASLGRVQWTLQAEMHQDGKLIATATQAGYHVNSATQAPIWVPETLLQTYWDYQWSL
jgi:acyl-CoA thioesterase FadM